MNKREIIPGDTAYNKLFPLPSKLPNAGKLIVLLYLLFVLVVGLIALTSFFTN